MNRVHLGALWGLLAIFAAAETEVGSLFPEGTHLLNHIDVG